MNERQKRLMKAPSIEASCCPFCGRPWAERHHVVPRSAGGEQGPTITVCGFGNSSGCHGLLHSHRLHLDYTDEGWVFLLTEKPMKDHEADQLKGWRKIRDWNEFI